MMKLSLIKRFIIIFLVAISLAMIPSLVQARLTTASKVLINGIGDIRVGMTVRQAEVAGKTRIIQQGDTFGNCAYYTAQGIEGVGFMVIGGEIARVSIGDNSRITTLSGAKIGDTEERIKSLYPGQIRVTPHTYNPNGHYLTLIPRQPAYQQYRVVFETDGRRVTSFRAGRLPEVEYVEGCV